MRLIASHSNLMDEQEDILAYIEQLEVVNGLTVEEVRRSYQAFKSRKTQRRIADLAEKYSIEPDALKEFIDFVLARMIFDADQLSKLFDTQDLGWRQRVEQKNALVSDLLPLFTGIARGQEISGLSAYQS